MALYPRAELKLLPENASQSKIIPWCIIDHSAGGAGELYGWWMNPASNGLESHFWIGFDGRVVQYMDTTVRADANGKANRWYESGVGYVGAISIETASSVHASEPWTDAQVRALVDLHVWLIETHPTIKPVEMATPTSSGQAWHIKFGAPGPWTSARGKVCPGPKRIEQCRNVIYPRVAAHFSGSQPKPKSKDWFSMATEAQLRKIVREEVERGRASLHGTIANLDKKEADRHHQSRVLMRDALVRLGSIRGWAAAIATKAYGSYTAARERAIEFDNAPK